MMNKTWIIASFHSADHSRVTPPLELIEYLDAVGLFETSWMIFDHSKAGSDFGYPDKKSCDDETLAGTDKVFAALHRHVAAGDDDWAGADLNDRIAGETPVALYPTLTETGPRFHVGVYDDVVAHAQAGRLKSAELRIEIDQFSPADRLRVMLDGKSLSKPAVRYASRQDASHPSDVGGSSWLVWSLPAGQVDFGDHEVKIHLLRRNGRVKAPLVVRHVEIHVSYV